MRDLIPPKIYKIITKLTIIAANDVLVKFEDKYLLLKRRNEPAKGLWWTPGGRISKNESVADSVHRVVKEELGIERIKIKKFLGVFEFFFRPGKFNQKDFHAISFAFLVEPTGNFKIKMDSQHSEYKFLKNPPRNAHPFINKLFYLAKKKNFSVSLPGCYRTTK